MQQAAVVSKKQRDQRLLLEFDSQFT